MINKFGAVSPQVAAAMAAGALTKSGVDMALSVTGIAGPGGATTGKPVGLVYIALAMKGEETRVGEYHFKGGRSKVRLAAVKAAIALAGSL